MKKIVLFGNCQISKISTVISYLLGSELFTVRNLKQVQHVENNNYFKSVRDVISEADFIITQNISGDKDPFVHIIPYIKPSAKVSIIDSLFCSFYHPELMMSHKIPSFKIGKLHDINVLSAFLRGMTADDFLKEDFFNKPGLYSSVIYEYIKNDSYTNLLSRQARLFEKIEVTKFNNRNIDLRHVGINSLFYNISNYKRELWGDLNHPHNEVYRFLTERILGSLDIEFNAELFDSEYNQYKNDLLIKYPIYYSTAKAFNFSTDRMHRTYDLGFDYTNKTRVDYVVDIFDHYSNIKRNVVLNPFVDHIRDKAISLEKIDVGLSFYYMSMAHQLRPSGNLIRQKMDQYSRLIDAV